MVDLAKFYADHGDRLRKHLPNTFTMKYGGFVLITPYDDAEEATFELRPDEAAIFLEHAARRVLEEQRNRRDEDYTDWRLSDFVAHLNTLFPKETL